MEEKRLIVLPKKLQKEIIKFFWKTSIPRILEKKNS